MNNHPDLDPATSEFLNQFSLGLSSVRNVSGQLDHHNRILKARGGFSAVYLIRWVPQNAQPIEVRSKLYCMHEIDTTSINPRFVIKKFIPQLAIWQNRLT